MERAKVSRGSQPTLSLTGSEKLLHLLLSCASLRMMFPSVNRLFPSNSVLLFDCSRHQATTSGRSQIFHRQLSRRYKKAAHFACEGYTWEKAGTRHWTCNPEVWYQHLWLRIHRKKVAVYLRHGSAVGKYNIELGKAAEQLDGPTKAHQCHCPWAWFIHRFGLGQKVQENVIKAQTKWILQVTTTGLVGKHRLNFSP